MYNFKSYRGINEIEDYYKRISSNKRLIKKLIMELRTLKLSDNLINVLISLPESGMSYQIVKVILKSGKI